LAVAACAASGHAIAVPPRSVTNSRRCMCRFQSKPCAVDKA
jgi:hypothetical protein